MKKRTLAIKFDREKFHVKEVNDIMNLIYNQIDDSIQIIPMFDGMKIYNTNIFESENDFAGGIYFHKFTDMETTNRIIDKMIKAPQGCKDFDEWQQKLP